MAQVSFFPMDLSVDLFMLAAVQLALGTLHIPRLIAAQLLLSVSTLAFLALGQSSAPPWLTPVLFLSSAALASGANTFRRFLEAGACMFCASSAAAGFALLFRRKPLMGAFSGIALLLLLLRRRRNMKYKWNIELSAERDGLYARFEALIDTGNRLREHASGLPVLIVEADAAAELAAHAAKLPESEKRTLPFGALSGAGKISCFRADRILMHPPGEKPVAAPKCWIGIYPGRIPGVTRALAPPEFAEALHKKSFIPDHIQDGARRFCYGVFKR